MFQHSGIAQIVSGTCCHSDHHSPPCVSATGLIITASMIAMMEGPQRGLSRLGDIAQTCHGNIMPKGDGTYQEAGAGPHCSPGVIVTGSFITTIEWLPATRIADIVAGVFSGVIITGYPGVFTV